MKEKIEKTIQELEERVSIYETNYYSPNNTNEDRVRWAEACDTMKEAIYIVRNNLVKPE